VENIGGETLEQQIMRHCEIFKSGTISKQDLTQAIIDTCEDNGTSIPSAQTTILVDQIFNSAGGGTRPITRIKLKQAIHENISDLKLIEKELPAQNPLVNMVLEILDESKHGLIPKKEMQEAVKKIIY